MFTPQRVPLDRLPTILNELFKLGEGLSGQLVYLDEFAVKGLVAVEEGSILEEVHLCLTRRVEVLHFYVEFKRF